MTGVEFKAQGERKAEILLYDVIGGDMFGDGTTSRAFVDELHAMGELDEINVRINSPGGSVFHAFAIYNALMEHKARVVVDIDGLAASAASFIAMAGNEIRMAETAMIMIHEAHGAVMGTADDMLKTASVLGKLTAQIAGIYAKRSGARASAFLRAMADETWYTASEAKEAKLITSISKPIRAAACFDLAKFGFKNAPTTLPADTITVVIPEQTKPVEATLVAQDPETTAEPENEPEAKPDQVAAVGVALTLLELDE